eukprot:GHVO01010178.1.p1 GENE.GHVO01010178.1~~GHVO01010178.1.p1  ORF type:complete len:218 (+),score=45.71 GHVO01010178.1:609-1262(+)
MYSELFAINAINSKKQLQGSAGLLIMYLGWALAAASIFAVGSYCRLLPTELPGGEALQPDLPEEHVESAFPSGVDVGELENIQAAMHQRIEELGETANEISDNAVSIEDLTRNSVMGTNVVTRIVQPFTANAQENIGAVDVSQTSRWQRIITGDMTPPILILEGTPLDALESLEMLKVLTCTNEIEESFRPEEFEEYGDDGEDGEYDDGEYDDGEYE